MYKVLFYVFHVASWSVLFGILNKNLFFGIFNELFIFLTSSSTSLLFELPIGKNQGTFEIKFNIQHSGFLQACKTAFGHSIIVKVLMYLRGVLQRSGTELWISLLDFEKKI